MTTTSQAAELIGVKYETLRNWLKRGLLDGAQPSEGLWRRFGDTDLCCLQLMKEGLSAGVSTETMLDVCQDRETVRAFDRLCSGQGGSSFSRPQHILIWPTLPEALFMLAPAQTIADELAANPSPVMIFDLSYIHGLLAAGLGGPA